MSSKKTYKGDSSSSESDVSTETSSSDDGVGDSDDDIFHGPDTEPRGSPPSSRTRSRSSTTTKTTSKSKSKSKVTTKKDRSSNSNASSTTTKRRLKVRTKSKSKATTKKDRTSNSNASSTTTKRTTSTPKDSSTDSVSPRGKLIQKNPKIKSFKPKRITAGKPEERKDAIVDPKKIQSFVNPTGRMLTRKDIADPGEIGSFNGLHRGDNDHLYVYLRLVNYNPRKYTKVPVFEISKGMSNSTFCMSFYA